MTYRVIQWATGLVGQEAILGVLAHPELELVGTWVHSPDKVGRDVGEICGIEPIGVTAVGTIEEICAIDADAVVYSPVLASTRDVIALLESGKNVVTPVGWIYPPRVTERRRARSRVPGRGRHAARHRDQPGWHHRALPADAVGVVPRHPPRARGGVLRHPQLPDRDGRPRHHAVRQGPGDGQGEPDAEGARRRVHAVDRHDRGRARLRTRPREVGPPRDGGRDQAARHAGRRHRRRHRRRAALHVGRHGQRRARGHGARELADGRSGSRPAVDARRAALRGRVRRRSAARGHVPRPAPAGDR